MTKTVSTTEIVDACHWHEVSSPLRGPYLCRCGGIFLTARKRAKMYLICKQCAAFVVADMSLADPVSLADCRCKDGSFPPRSVRVRVRQCHTGKGAHKYHSPVVLEDSFRRGLYCFNKGGCLHNICDCDGGDDD